MKRRIISSEQPQSLVAALEEAGVRHGDVTEVVMTAGVGFEGRKPILAFCPTVVQSVRVLKQGTSQDHDQPISTDVRLHYKRDLAGVIGQEPCFITGRAMVSLNGSTQITFDMDSVRTHRPRGYRVNSRDARPYSHQLLAGVK